MKTNIKTTPETISKNITLAKYHKQAFYSRTYSAWWMATQIHSDKAFRLYSDKTLDYHCNLNNSMSLVDQIEDLGYKFKICRRRCQICKDDLSEEYFIDVKMKTKAESIFEACYKFITEYYTNCEICDSTNLFQFYDYPKVNNETKKMILNYCKDCSHSWNTISEGNL